jgi:Major Facilitator Superfamily
VCVVCLSLIPYFARPLSLHIASVERLRFPAFVYLAAVIKGFAGGHIVMKVAGLAYIAETSTPDMRSFYFGLFLVTSVAAHALGSLVSGGLIMRRHFAASFAVGTCTWIIYLLYLVLVVREPERHKIPDGTLNTVSSDDSVTPQESNTSRGTLSMIREGPKRLATAAIQPLAFIVTDPTLVLLGIMEFLIMLALGAFVVLIIWSDYMFGLTPREVRLLWVY